MVATWKNGCWRHTIHGLHSTDAATGKSVPPRGHQSPRKRRWNKAIQFLVMTETGEKCPCKRSCKTVT